MFRKALLLCLCLMPSAALADWQEASSRHFVLYSNDKPERVRAFTTRLERFDKALRVQRGMPDEPISPETRLTVYVVDDTDDVQKLVRGQENIAGFYEARAHPVAFVPRQSGTGDKTDLNAQQILLHEYTHHFMLSNWTNAAFPAWFVEGFAEFNATAIFRDDGGITLGAPPQYRAFGIFNSSMLPIERVLSPNPGRLDQEQTDVLYGRGWLLTHYLTFEPSRVGQLNAYIAAINAGKPIADAKRELKDIDKLDRVLSRYAEQPRLPARTLTGSALAVGETAVRALTPAEAAVMPVRIRSAAGVNRRRPWCSRVGLPRPIRRMRRRRTCSPRPNMMPAIMPQPRRRRTARSPLLQNRCTRCCTRAWRWRRRHAPQRKPTARRGLRCAAGSSPPTRLTPRIRCP
jgi:hypothetical protein